jgi:flagellar hook-length control protein FliK
MSATALRTLPVAPVPVPAPAQAPTPAPQAKANAAHPFAELLRQNRAAAATPAAPAEASNAPPPKSDETHAATGAAAPDESASNEPAASQRDARQAKARSAGAAREDAAPSTQAAAPAPDAPADEATARSNDERDSPTSPPDASLAAGAALAAGPGAAPGAKAAAADATAATTRARGTAAVAAAGTAVAAKSSDRHAASGASLSPLGDGAQGAVGEAGASRDVASNGKDDIAVTSDARDTPALDVPAAASFAGLLAESKTSHGASAGAHATSDVATAAPPGTGLVAGNMPNAGTVATATLPVPMHAPEFAAAFGVQVSVLAKDGVQHAELHLNPAEMGPVSIQITLDGTQARVDFGADAAATRHAIEAGLPELASALRDAGFTLAGGGVAQHSASNGGGDDRNGEGGRAASSRASALPSRELDAAAARVTRRIADGGVDLYA